MILVYDGSVIFVHGVCHLLFNTYIAGDTGSRGQFVLT